MNGVGVHDGLDDGMNVMDGMNGSLIDSVSNGDNGTNIMGGLDGCDDCMNWNEDDDDDNTGMYADDNNGLDDSDTLRKRGSQTKVPLTPVEKKEVLYGRLAEISGIIETSSNGRSLEEKMVLIPLPKS